MGGQGEAGCALGLIDNRLKKIKDFSRKRNNLSKDLKMS